MFVFDWILSWLSFFGLDLRTPGKVLFLGLDNAGKTSLLARLKSDKMVTVESTQHPSTPLDFSL
jgi:GTP-binding protein SAR1